MKSPSMLSAALGALLLAALSACQSPPPPPAPTQVAHTKQVIATVESVDMSTRQVLLRTPDGARATVVAGPEVRNLPQLRAGDRVNVTYQAAIAVQMAQPGTTPINAAALVTQRAAPGQLPGGAVSGVISARVTVVSVAPEGTSVTFTGPSGVSHIAEVSDPQMQSFVQRLRPGDQVDVGYVNEVAVSVEPCGERFGGQPIRCPAATMAQRCCSPLPARAKVWRESVMAVPEGAPQQAKIAEGYERLAAHYERRERLERGLKVAVWEGVV